MTREELWSLFEDRLCDLSTSAFLAEPEFVRLIEPLAKAHKDASVNAVRQALVRANRFDVGAFAESQTRIALTNCQLANFAGSELWTRDIALYLANLGLPLIVYSPDLGAIAQHMAEAGIDVTDDAAVVAAFKPDIVHINHHASVAPLLGHLGSRPKVVNMVHGLLPRLGLPAPSGVDTYASVAVHATAKIQLLTGTPWEAVRPIANFFDENRFPEHSQRRAPRALLFSSKTKSSQRDRLGTMLAQVGYQVDHAGYGGVLSTVPEELLMRYDLVFAVARSAIEALASGCRVVLWDDGLIGPLVTGQNFWLCVASNFSMASCLLPFCPVQDDAAAEWLSAQVGGSGGEVAAAMTRQHLSLHNVGPTLLALYEDTLGSQT